MLEKNDNSVFASQQTLTLDIFQGNRVICPLVVPQLCEVSVGQEKLFKFSRHASIFWKKKFRNEEKT